MHLADDREAVAREPLGDPELPERPGAIERLVHDAAAEAL
jgi:hypothetical protein